PPIMLRTPLLRRRKATRRRLLAEPWCSTPCWHYSTSTTTEKSVSKTLVKKARITPPSVVRLRSAALYAEATGPTRCWSTQKHPIRSPSPISVPSADGRPSITTHSVRQSFIRWFLEISCMKKAGSSRASRAGDYYLNAIQKINITQKNEKYPFIGLSIIESGRLPKYY